MSSKLICLPLLLVIVHLVSFSLGNTEERVWRFDSDKEIMNPATHTKMPQIVCYGWYCKRVERVKAVCKGKDFSLSPKIDYTCQIVNLPWTYKLADYSITCKDFTEQTNDHCYLTVKVTDAD